MRRRYGITAGSYLTNYFRLTAEEHDATFTIAIGTLVNSGTLAYIEYSTNEGKSWTKVNNVATATTVSFSVEHIDIGSSVLLRGSGTRTSAGSGTESTAQSTRISANKNFSASGVLTTLINPRATAETTISTTYTFALLFFGSTKLISVRNLIFPPNTVANCFRGMFKNCSNLVYGPTLPAVTLSGSNCYHTMLVNCTKLKYLKVMATANWNSTYMSTWISATLAGCELWINPSLNMTLDGLGSLGANGIPQLVTLFDGTEDQLENYTFIDPEVHRIVLLRWGGRMGGNSNIGRWKNSIRIGGTEGNISKRQLNNIIAIYNEFKENTLITDLSDFDKFTGLLYIGTSNSSQFHSSTTIGFYNCTSLASITLPNTVKHLSAGYTYGKGCFMNTAIQEIYIPDSVTAASDHLFHGCTLLTSVRWSSNLPIRVNTTSYCKAIFYGCSNLTEITNYPSTGSIIPADNFRNCSKLDISQFYSLLLGAVNIGAGSISGTKVTNLPQDLIFYNLVSCAGDPPGNLAGVGRRRLFLPKCTNISLYGLGGNSASLIDLGNVTGSYFNPGNGNSSTNTVTVILRSVAVPTFSTFNKTNVRRIYVYSSIIDDFKANSKYSTAASITFPIGGEEWATEFGSYYEYADYPVSDPVVYTESLGGSISIDFPMYNPDITLNLQFRGRDYRSIVLPFGDVRWEYTRMGGDEFREITGVTATVDGEGNLTGFTVQSLTVTGNITPNKPYLVTTGMNGDGISGEYYTEILHSNNVVQSTNAITDEFTSNGYKFSFTGTYNFIDNMKGKYAFDGTNWNLCSSNDTMKATYVYMEVTKIEE